MNGFDLKKALEEYARLIQIHDVFTLEYRRINEKKQAEKLAEILSAWAEQSKRLSELEKCQRRPRAS